ncbi:class I SAM-dependent methyltransferase [Demequina capsici]|uniref:Class I SAM-dependent methyltransferase n=1 Tax=Demequina capsici TaxID=3075620 RepID=A0AA96F971_9MICO|nr:class I SAM-dependent methyltransferase [Demequina sp. OYTSA14]WNM25824.1 class I SAM-dependent methyltransferase [Demequina sp. OYTSA14]
MEHESPSHASPLPVPPDLARRAFWHDRYAEGSAWSGHVNPALAEVASTLEPGTALDLGCGEGGDVLWLAEHGWHATGLDGAAPALDRARREAGRRGLTARCDLIEAELARWQPDRAWDLVACHYLHEDAVLRERVLSAAIDAVAPGGTLLFVGHHPDEPEELAGPRRHTRFRAEDLAASSRLAEGWRVQTSTRPRVSVRQGIPVDRLDTVLVATAPSP